MDTNDRPLPASSELDILNLEASPMPRSPEMLEIEYHSTRVEGAVRQLRIAAGRGDLDVVHAFAQVLRNYTEDLFRVLATSREEVATAIAEMERQFE